MESVDRVLTLGDLDQLTLPAVPLAVLGDPIEHSLSPAMHNAALAALAEEDPVFADWHYFRVRVAVNHLECSVARLFALGFKGLNLTLPHKIEAFDLVTAVEPAVAAMGAVNTLLATELGYRGTNTDGWGIARAVERAFDRRLGEGPVVLCGAGGAARAVAVQALNDGVRDLWLGNRGEQNLTRLLQQLTDAGHDLSGVRPFLFDAPPVDVPDDALLINATSAGLRADDALPFSPDFLGPEGAILDTTYGTPNAWRRWAAERGVPYADGLLMLVYQGQRSLELWTGREVPTEVMLNAAQNALAARSVS
ncbi:MAG: shikimate dehydrogenase family protein [Opitutales bacterium]